MLFDVWKLFNHMDDFNFLFSGTVRQKYWAWFECPLLSRCAASLSPSDRRRRPRRACSARCLWSRRTPRRTWFSSTVCTARCTTRGARATGGCGAVGGPSRRLVAGCARALVRCHRNRTASSTNRTPAAGPRTGCRSTAPALESSPSTTPRTLISGGLNGWGRSTGQSADLTNSFFNVKYYEMYILCKKVEKII